ncbi:hypothetical protein [Methylobacterium sp. E-045]|uniref:hypothetical protein n=1 Tax=Methylobacterium sp. E-045 TaxID=2836575 RepID=UPI001FBA77BE|nr:hypothetical protein [Methylobacterium sp. E-045]MCJ2132429.1 hypothetical protein [Methylobacterium sp. E-045]
MSAQARCDEKRSSLVVDTYHDSYREALCEATRRRNQAGHEGSITNVTKSAYGRYVVRSLPAEFILDMAVDGTPMPGFMTGFGFGGTTFND